MIKLERIKAYVISLLHIHLVECQYCKGVVYASQAIEEKVLCLASCLLKNEGLAPYQQQKFITLQDVINIVTVDVNSHRSLYKEATICEGCRDQWCEGCVPEEYQVTPLTKEGSI